MHDDNLLIQRYLENELSTDERARFEQRIAQDDSLQQRIEAARALLADMATLPHPKSRGATLSDRIMRDVLTLQPRSRWWKRFVQPIRVPAWVAALVLVALGIAIGSTLRRPSPVSEPVIARAVVPHQARVVEKDTCAPPEAVPVRFVLYSPGSRHVSLVGDFNDWQPQQDALTDSNANGVWTIEVPLKPGRYQYKFVVDGNWVADPDAPAYTVDGFGGKNALISL